MRHIPTTNYPTYLIIDKTNNNKILFKATSHKTIFNKLTKNIDHHHLNHTLIETKNNIKINTYYIDTFKNQTNTNIPNGEIFFTDNLNYIIYKTNSNIN